MLSPSPTQLSSCAHSIPESCSPPRAPATVGAGTSSIFAASNCHQPLSMCFDVRRSLAGISPGIYTAGKNQSAIFTLGTQRQQQLCRGPCEVFTKNWASQLMTKGRDISPRCFKGWLLFKENPLLNKYWGAHKQPAWAWTATQATLQDWSQTKHVCSSESVNTGKIPHLILGSLAYYLL